MKKRFYVYQSWEEQMELLSTEEKATMLMNLFKYQRGEEPTLDTTGLKLVWAGIKFLLEKDDTEYQNAVQRGKNAVLKRQTTEPHNNVAEPHNNVAEPQILSAVPQIELRHRIDNVNDNVNDNDNVNGNGDGGDWMMMFRQGETPKSLRPKYPYHLNEITSSWMEYIEK